MRFVQLDMVAGLSGWRRLGAELLGALAALLLVAALRGLIDIWLPNTAPYALAYPGLLIATLIGRLRSGLIGWVGIFGYLWWVGINHGPDYRFADPLDLPRTIINVVVGLMVVLLTESARAAASSLLADREQRVAERDMLLAEFDHRLQNNLTILSSLIAMQARAAENPAVEEALDKAASRIASLGQTYAHLRYEPGAIREIDVGQLLDSLCAALRESLIAGSAVALEQQSCVCMLDRNRAAALALLINELITNAVKHAFVGRTGGKIHVGLEVDGSEGLLTIRDDGVGLPAETPKGRQGMRLLNALAKMAQADLVVSSSNDGTKFEVRLRDIASA
ncbi:MAG: sensor histidine kinase [Pseudomonadota bacterium]|nr:sensor histidine kinase [Pseudomonadota bacterium]